MPNIVINEIDKTTPGTLSEKTDIVFIPGFATRVRSKYEDYSLRAKKDVPTLCTTVREFETYFGKEPAVFQSVQSWNYNRGTAASDTVAPIDGFSAELEDYVVGTNMFEVGDVDPSYIYAKELLAQGIPVLYVRVNKDNEYPTVKDMYAALSGVSWDETNHTTLYIDSVYAPLVDKGEYKVKYITSGGYPTFGWQADGQNRVDEVDFESFTITDVIVDSDKFVRQSLTNGAGTYTFTNVASINQNVSINKETFLEYLAGTDGDAGRPLNLLPEKNGRLTIQVIKTGSGDLKTYRWKKAEDTANGTVLNSLDDIGISFKDGIEPTEDYDIYISFVYSLNALDSQPADWTDITTWDTSETKNIKYFEQAAITPESQPANWSEVYKDYTYRITSNGHTFDISSIYTQVPGNATPHAAAARGSRFFNLNLADGTITAASTPEPNKVFLQSTEVTVAVPAGPKSSYYYELVDSSISPMSLLSSAQAPTDWVKTNFPQDKYYTRSGDSEPFSYTAVNAFTAYTANTYYERAQNWYYIQDNTMTLFTGTVAADHTSYYKFEEGLPHVPPYVNIEGTQDTVGISYVKFIDQFSRLTAQPASAFAPGKFFQLSTNDAEGNDTFGQTGKWNLQYQPIVGSIMTSDVYDLSSYMTIKGEVEKDNTIIVKEVSSGGTIIPVKMEAVARTRGDCVAVIDHTPNANRPIKPTSTNSIFYRVNNSEKAIRTDGKYATLFTPWLNFTCPYTSTTIDLPPSFAYFVDLAKSISNGNPNYFSIAGITRGQVPYYNYALTAETLTQAIADSYQPRSGGITSINPITNIKPYGQVIWGNRTLHKNDDELTASSFLDIRNMVSDIKKVVYDTAIKLIFEKNSDILWTKFCNGVGNYLDKLQSSQGITGYKIIKGTTDSKAKLVATIRISPIYSLEDIDVTIELVDDNVLVS